MFKLNIECTKDISELHINFTDGSSAVVENAPKTSEKPKPKIKSREEPENKDPRFKDFDYQEPVDVISKERVKLPEIPDRQRAVKVADELQNLDI